jgi:hypothetical protein
MNNPWEEELDPIEDMFQEKMYFARETLKDIVSQLYGQKELNIDEFESDLEELCHSMKVTLPSNKIQIERSKLPEPDYLVNWKGFNENYLKNIAI